MQVGRRESRWTKTAAIAVGFAVLAALAPRASAVVLGFGSVDTPSFAVFNGRLFMAYTGTDSNHRLNYAVSSDAVNFTQVTDGGNRAAGGPAIAAFNGNMYVAFAGTDHKINIAVSADGQHYAGQYQVNWFTPWRPALASGGGALWLAWLASDGSINTASSTDGINWTPRFTRAPITTTVLGITFRSFAAFPPTLASPDGVSIPDMVYTWSQSQQNASPPGGPNVLEIIVSSATGGIGIGATSCRTSPTGGGIQAGLGFLPGESLMPFHESQQIALDVNGGSCHAGGTTDPSPGSPTNGSFYGLTGVAPAAVGFNGHAYVAWTGTDGGQHINIIQAF